ncbi:MAG: sigma 54-interacting transcriptional regulator [Thermoguttaceae bacterium]|jgi:DNA-binding NtrC family response regulator
MSLAYDTRAQGLLRRIDFGTRSAGPPAEFVAQSPAMRKVLEMAAKIGPTDCTVLIEGEPSVGKESVARIIHRQSNRAGGPFMRVPCGGIPKSRLYEQLFGRAGNGSPKKNRTDRSFLTCAKGGTLFLDGISQLPLWAQIKLYDILQEEWRNYCGDAEIPPPAIRVIASTACDLEAAAACGRFHSSLYFYLNIAKIRVPPLRYRPEDIRPLGERVLSFANSANGPYLAAKPHRLSEEAWQCLSQYDWPGNIAELSSVIVRAILNANSEAIDREDVSSLFHKNPRPEPCNEISVPLGGELRDIERYIISEVIRRCHGNKTAAARTLKLPRRTLYRLLDGRDIKK